MKMNSASKFFLLLSIVSLTIFSYLLWERTNPERLSFTTIFLTHQQVHISKTAPKRLVIKSEKIDLPILPAQIKEGEWNATTAGVSYLLSSPLPGAKGNSIMYGHNFPNLLGNLTKVKPGDIITVTYNNNTKRDFVVEYTSTVSPSETYILAPSQDKRLTLYTCTGFLDTKRFVVTAVLHES